MSDPQMQQVQQTQQQIQTRQAEEGPQLQPGVYRNLSVTQQPGVTAQGEAFQHIVPVEVVHQNEQLRHSLEQTDARGWTANPFQASAEEVASDYRPKKESIKEKRERRRQKENAVKANCFRKTANAGYLHQIANRRLQDTPSASGERNGESMEELKKNLLGFPIDSRVLQVARLHMNYVRETLPGVLAMRDRVEIMRDKLEGDGAGVWSTPEEKAQIEDQIKIFDVYFEKFRILASDYGVDVKTGAYLQKPLTETEQETKDRLTVTMQYLQRREEARQELSRQELAKRTEESKNQEIVKELTDQERERYGSCSYHKYMSKEDAEEVVKSGDGFLYAQQVGEGVYEVRATLPKEVEIGGEKVALRRTYNQLLKAMLRPLLSKDGKSLRDTSQNIDFQILDTVSNQMTSSASVYLSSLHVALSSGDMDKLRELLTPSLQGTGEEKEKFFKDLTLLYSVGDKLLQGEPLDGIDIFFDRLGESRKGEKNLDARIKAIQDSNLTDDEKALQVRTAINFHSQVRAGEQEMLELLNIDDDEIDVPLPGQCSGSAEFLKRMKTNIALAKANAEARKEGKEKADEETEKGIRAEMEKDLYEFLVLDHGMMQKPIYLMKGYLEARDRSRKNGSNFYYEDANITRKSLQQMLKLGFVEDEKDQAVLQTWISELCEEALPKEESYLKRTAEELEQEWGDPETDWIKTEEKQKKYDKNKEYYERDMQELQATKDRLAELQSRLSSEEKERMKSKEEREKILERALRAFQKKCQEDPDYLKNDTSVEFPLSSNDFTRYFHLVDRGDAVTYTYHKGAALGKTKDGRTVVSETFAPEAVEYTKAPFTREHKAMGFYQDGVNGFRASYSQDKLVVDQESADVIKLNGEATGQRKFPGQDLLDKQNAQQ